jgi:hypothetical protein
MQPTASRPLQAFTTLALGVQGRNLSSSATYVFYAFCAWWIYFSMAASLDARSIRSMRSMRSMRWIYFPQSGALAESTTRPVSHKQDELFIFLRDMLLK